MPNKKNHSNDINKIKSTGISRNSSNKKCPTHNANTKLVCFENSLAAKATEEDIIQACSLYNKTQEKVIKLKIAQIYFN